METMSALLAGEVRGGKTAPAQRFRGPQGWEGRTYAQLHALVRRTAHRLSELGAGSGGSVAIVSRTRPEWTIVDLAAALIGAPVVPVYPTATQTQFDLIEESATPA